MEAGGRSLGGGPPDAAGEPGAGAGAGAGFLTVSRGPCEPCRWEEAR